MEGAHMEFTPPDDFFATMPIFESDAGITQPLPLISSSGINVGGRVTSASSEDSTSRYRNFQDRGMSNNDPCFGTDQTPIQQLSQLDYELIILRAKLEQAAPEVMMHALFEGTGKGDSSCSSVMNDILGKTMHFVDILSRLSKACILEIELSSRTSTHSSYNSNRRSSSTSLSIYSAHDSDAAASPRQETNNPQLTSSPKSENAHVELDTPALLLILASYSRIIGIYLIVFSHIYEHLKTISESDNPHLRPISGLSISSYSARKRHSSPLYLAHR
jgi:hypothetical protein